MVSAIEMACESSRGGVMVFSDSRMLHQNELESVKMTEAGIEMPGLVTDGFTPDIVDDVD